MLLTGWKPVPRLSFVTRLEMIGIFERRVVGYACLSLWVGGGLRFGDGLFWE